jgi:hypothetical protein
MEKTTKTTKKSTATKTAKTAKTTKALKEVEIRKKVLFVASEAQPFCATGGLADVCGSLPKEIKREDPSIDIRTIIPLYSNIPNCFRKDFKFIGHTYVTLSWRKEYCGVFEYEHEGIKYYFIDNEKYFKVCMDVGHTNKALRFAGNPTPQDAVLRLGKAIVVTHLHDNDGITDQHKIPMTGTINWSAVLDALDQIGFDGYYNLELNLRHFGADFSVQTARFGVEVMQYMLQKHFEK